MLYQSHLDNCDKHTKFKKLFSRPIKINLSLIGKVQAENASLACLCAKILFPEISEEIIEKGLNKCTLQGRFEIAKNPLNKKSEIIYDGAHTVKSIKGTLDSYKRIFHIENHKGILIFAVAADKDIEHIAKEIIEKFNHAYQSEKNYFNLNVGLVMLLVLMFFVLSAFDWNMVTVGLMFLISGCSLFGANFCISKKIKKEQLELQKAVEDYE